MGHDATMYIMFCIQVLPGHAGIPGGEQQITEDDKVNVEKAKKMVIEDVEEKHKKDNDYKTTDIVFSDWVITKQVHFILYQTCLFDIYF